MPTLDPQLDTEWLTKLEKQPHDKTLREAYFAALDAAEDPRAELVRLEKRVAELDLAAPERAALKSRRNELRLAISPEWRDRFGFGTRPGCDKPFPWPEDTATRWLSIYEYIEEVRGVWLPEDAKPAFATHRSSVKAWELLIGAIRRSDKDYWALFRDSISLSKVPGYSKLYSLMVAGEDDFHWAVAYTKRDDEDPPVHGLNLDYNTGKFVPSRITAPSNSTSFHRVTDFVRIMFETYNDLGRDDRFLYQGSKAPDKLYRSWGKLTISRPSAEELGTAHFADQKGSGFAFSQSEARNAVVDALSVMDCFGPDDETDDSRTFGSLGLDDNGWAELIDVLGLAWQIDLDPKVSYKSLSIEGLAACLKSMEDEDE